MFCTRTWARNSAQRKLRLLRTCTLSICVKLRLSGTVCGCAHALLALHGPARAPFDQDKWLSVRDFDRLTMHECFEYI